MPINQRNGYARRQGTPRSTGMTPEDLLAQALAERAAIVLGNKATAIETPQLGRVAYVPPDIELLDQYIADLMAMIDPSTAVLKRRKPISIEACP